MKTVIFHYHLFKNAGTSFDDSLQRNFSGNKWVTKEFPYAMAPNIRQQKKWIKDHPEAVCFSSHTAHLTNLTDEETTVIPIIFMRHPIDRIASAYSFEKKQGGDSFGSVLARNTSLAGYIETRLALANDRQCRNFHVDRFCRYVSESEGIELERAKKAVDRLNFVGDVGKYDESLENFEMKLKGLGFEEIALKSVKKNVSRVSKSIEEKMSDLKSEIGEDLFGRLYDANLDDIALYEYMKQSKGYS